MEDPSAHASLSDLRECYHHLFFSGLSFSRLKDEALTDRLFPKDTDGKASSPSEEASASVPGRSVAWKLFLAKHEPLQASLPPRPSSLVEGLRKSRDHFAKLHSEKTKPPDERLAGVPAAARASDASRNVNLNNPLSLHNENPWNEWFAGLEVKRTISQDVERTFPDIPFFRESDIQNQLTDILFIYASTHPRIGYRQGMHELLAPLYYAIYYDSIEQDAAVEPELREICSRKCVSADAWALFDTVMDGVSKWYEWREPDAKARAYMGGQANGISGHVHLVAPAGPNGIQPWVAPIVQACNRIQNQLLKKVDPTLWASLQKAGVEPQIYGIRWLRMLFTREFSMSDSMKLWDALFACDPSLVLAEWVCVAMLIRIRINLIDADYSSQLTSLLRYPPCFKSNLDDVPTHTCLLLQQALSLQMAPTPATAATITMENKTLLGIGRDVSVGSAPSSPNKRAPPATTRHSAFIPPRTNTGLKEKDPPRPGHMRQASSPGVLSFPEMLSRGILERGEGLGINKTLLSAVSELKRNIPDIAGFVRSPLPDEASFPLENERPVAEQPPWEPRSRLDMEREISKLKAKDKRIGESLGWIVDVLLQDEESVKDGERLRKQRREAVESLAYIRDVLISGTTELEEERLTGDETGVGTSSKTEERRPIIAPPAPPQPVSVAGSGSRPSTDRKVIRPSPITFSPNKSVISSSSTESRGPVQNAPWNHTKSNFSRVGVGMPATVLPRKPPPTSSGRRVEVYDPLGALEYK